MEYLKKLDFNTKGALERIAQQKTSLKKLKDHAKGENIISTQVIRQKHLDVHYAKIKVVEDITSLPQPGEQYRYITQNEFNAFTLLLYTMQKFDKVEELIITTFNMNEKTILCLLELLDSGFIGKLTVLVSESISFRMPKRLQQLEQAIEERREWGRFSAALSWNHSKITLMQTGGNYFVFEGSGNMTENAHIEQYLFENNEQSYHFHKSWIDQIFSGEQNFKRQRVL